MPDAVTRADVEAAARRLVGITRRTPLLRAAAIDREVGAPVVLKAENLQRGGAFKLRGAYNAIAVLTGTERARGVFAYSSGNHAQGVAIAARTFGIGATILMPEDAPPEKVAATRRHGAEVITYDRYEEDREGLGEQLAAERGATLIPPYDHDPTIAGQGTIALEIFADHVGEPIRTLIGPMGGGGLLAGCSVVAPTGVTVLGAEPEARTSARDAFRTGEPVTVAVPRTIADGQQTTAIGRRPWAVLRERAAGALGATEAAIVAAMRLIHGALGLQVEPSGACALAACLEHDVQGPVAVVVSGGNIAPARFAALTAAGGQ